MVTLPTFVSTGSSTGGQLRESERRRGGEKGREGEGGREGGEEREEEGVWLWTGLGNGQNSAVETCGLHLLNLTILVMVLTCFSQ